MRSLASQLKQERATSNAMISGGGHPDEAASSSADGAAGAGLTLASAASQILLLRREVKFLQKQWKGARVDQDQVAVREQLQSLRDEVAEGVAALAAAGEAHESTRALARLLARELKTARAQMREQASRVAERSAAQRTAAALKERLAELEERYEAQALQLKRLKLENRAVRREPLPGAVLDSSDEEEYAAELNADTSHHIFGLLLLTQELTALERGLADERHRTAGLVRVKSDLSLRCALLEDTNTELGAEVAKLRGRVSALQEEKEVIIIKSSVIIIKTKLRGRVSALQEEKEVIIIKSSVIIIKTKLRGRVSALQEEKEVMALSLNALCHDTAFLIWQVMALSLNALCHDTAFLIWQVMALSLNTLSSDLAEQPAERQHAAAAATAAVATAAADANAHRPPPGAVGPSQPAGLPEGARRGGSVKEASALDRGMKDMGSKLKGIKFSKMFDKKKGAEQQPPPPPQQQQQHPPPPPPPGGPLRGGPPPPPPPPPDGPPMVGRERGASLVFDTP